MTASILIGTRKVHRIPITAQSHARLRHEVPKILTADELDQLVDGDGKVSLGKQIAGFTDKAYRLLCVLAPLLASTMPEHEWQGYGSAEAMAAESYDGDQDNAPSIDQIVSAFDTALEVNGLKRLGSLIGLARDGQALLGGGDLPPANGRPQTPTLPA